MMDTMCLRAWAQSASVHRFEFRVLERLILFI